MGAHYVFSICYIENFLLILCPSCFAACGHHLHPRIAIVFSLLSIWGAASTGVLPPFRCLLLLQNLKVATFLHTKKDAVVAYTGEVAKHILRTIHRYYTINILQYILVILLRIRYVLLVTRVFTCSTCMLSLSIHIDSNAVKMSTYQCCQNQHKYISAMTANISYACHQYHNISVN